MNKSNNNKKIDKHSFLEYAFFPATTFFTDFVEGYQQAPEEEIKVQVRQENGQIIERNATF